MNSDRNCLSYWFPKLQSAGVPVPRTKIVHYKPVNPHDCVDLLLDGKMPAGFEELIEQLAAGSVEMGLPCFLRTGQTSGKHQWDRTCLVRDVDLLPHHVGELVEFSAMADFMGLPCNVWVVRELLPTKIICALPAYRGMPLTREFRCFVRGGEIVCIHIYWPAGSIEQGFPHTSRGFDEEGDRDVDPVVLQACIEKAHSTEGIDEVRLLAARVATAFADDGAWSVDILDTARGWFVTDMAVAADSFHWEGCAEADSFQAKRPVLS